MRISTRIIWIAAIGSAGTGLLMGLLAQPASPVLAVLVPLVCGLVVALLAHIGVGRQVNSALRRTDSVGKAPPKRGKGVVNRDEFLILTAHELRTPITTMLASLEMIRGGYAITPEDQLAFIDQAAAATRHLAFLVNDLQDCAAFEGGKPRIILRRCFLREVTKDVERLMVPLAKAQGVIMLTTHPADDLAVVGDQGRILQVIFNLMSNAIRYSPQHGTVMLRAIPTDVGAVFEVEDEGEGVPMEARKNLFTCFSGSGDQPAPPGTGLGLYVSRILVELMNGSIGFRERDEGQGSVFWFTLPIANPETQSGISRAVQKAT